MAKVEFMKDRCKGCGLCVVACPRKIIHLDQAELNSIGFHPASVEDMERCTGCAICAVVCPDSVIEVWR
jgi:2-oxoglutarate ferredoxin oxidoreductase subunit delta